MGSGEGAVRVPQDVVRAAGTPNLTQRLDFVFHDGSFVVEDTDVVGDELADITPSGLWPSDHAGVVASFTFVRP